MRFACWITKARIQVHNDKTNGEVNFSHETRKYAAIRFLYNRLNTYNLHEDEYKTEDNIIHNIM